MQPLAFFFFSSLVSLFSPFLNAILILIMPGHSRSIKSDPLGLIDTRVLTMADHSISGLLSPSSASALSFDDTSQEPPVDTQEPREKRHKTSSRREIATDDVLGEASHRLTWERQCPKLELDVAVDRYHGLDGFAVPLNPQNTPASRSEQGGSHELWPSCETENPRSGSAPQAPALTLDWLDDKPDNADAYQPADEDADWWRAKEPERRCSVADEPSPVVSPIFALRNAQQAANASPSKELQSPAPAKRVRFPSTPSSPDHSSCPNHRRFPSVERQLSCISSSQQKKLYVKWKSATRDHFRVSPHRIPVKTSSPLVNRLNRRPENRFSSLSSLPLSKTDPIRFASQPNTGHDAEENAGLQQSMAITDDGAIPTRKDRKLRKRRDLVVYSYSVHEFTFLTKRLDLAAVSFSVHRYSFLTHSSTRIPQVSTFEAQLLPSSQGASIQIEKAQVVCRSDVDNLILHVCLIMPVLVLRIPMAIWRFAERHIPARVRAAMANLGLILYFTAINAVFYVLGLNMSVRRATAPDIQSIQSQIQACSSLIE